MHNYLKFKAKLTKTFLKKKKKLTKTGVGKANPSYEMRFPNKNRP